MEIIGQLSLAIGVGLLVVGLYMIFIQVSQTRRQAKIDAEAAAEQALAEAEEVARLKEDEEFDRQIQKAIDEWIDEENT